MSAPAVGTAQSLELRLTIKANGTISATATEQGNIDDGQAGYEGLRKDTIDVLHDWLRHGRLRQKAELEVLGAHLFDVLFQGSILDAFRREYDEARKQQRRLVVRLNFGEGTDALSELPWEYLYSLGTTMRDGFFLAAGVDLMLSRYLDVERGEKPEPHEGPLRVLLVVSEPPDEPVKHFEADDFTAAIRRLSGRTEHSGQPAQAAQIEPLANPTLMKLIDAIGRVRPHVLHVVAPGRHVPDAGARIALAREDGEATDWISDDRFAAAFSAAAWRPSVVFLHLSETAPEAAATNGGQIDLNQSFERLGPSLVRTARIPAVIAMRSPVALNVATEFCSWFYHQLASGETVDAAVRQGRFMVMVNVGEAPAWSFGTPVLYLHELDGLVQQPLVTPEKRPDRFERTLAAQVEEGGGSAEPETPEADESRFAKSGPASVAESAATGDAPRNEVEALMSRAPRIIRAGRARLDTMSVDSETRLSVQRWLVGMQRELMPLSGTAQNDHLINMATPDDEARQVVLSAMVDVLFEIPET